MMKRSYIFAENTISLEISNFTQYFWVEIKKYRKKHFGGFFIDSVICLSDNQN